LYPDIHQHVCISKDYLVFVLSQDNLSLF
jgi:hypothetical protein